MNAGLIIQHVLNKYVQSKWVWFNFQAQLSVVNMHTCVCTFTTIVWDYYGQEGIF